MRVEVPRDRNGSFDPVTVPVGQRRLTGLDQMVNSLYAKGLATGDIASHLFDVYDQHVDRSTISRITDAVVDDMLLWQSRPLDSVYPVLLVDGIRIKIRDGTVTNRTVYVVMGINMEGERDILGLWVGPTSGESPKFWLTVMTELKNRGVTDVLMLCCDGLKGLPDSARAAWPLVDVQLCVVHLVRNSLRFASKKHWGQITRQLKTIYTAPGLDTAEHAFEDFAEQWDATYPAMIKSWRDTWDDFIPFLEFPVELRKIVYSTNAIESLNARFRKAAVRRGHFPTEQAGWIQLVSATPPIGEVMYGTASDSCGGSARVLGRCSFGHGDCRRCCSRGRVKDGRDAVVLACWRGDARTIPCRPTSDQSWSTVVQRTRGDQLPSRRRRRREVDRQGTRAFAIDNQS